MKIDFTLCMREFFCYTELYRWKCNRFVECIRFVEGFMQRYKLSVVRRAENDIVVLL